MKNIKPWRVNEECPLEGFQEFKEFLNSASYHNAADYSDEWDEATSMVRRAAQVAVDQGWPYWAMERMFKEVQPLVVWSSFMHHYIEILREK